MVGEGTGLGLSSVYGTVKNMNDAMQLESAVARGAVVPMRFPIGTLAVRRDIPTQANAVPVGGRTLFVVEDDDAVQNVMLHMLRHACPLVVEARTAPGRAGAHHPGLHTHPYSALEGPNREKVFEAYVENDTRLASWSPLRWPLIKRWRAV